MSHALHRLHHVHHHAPRHMSAFREKHRVSTFTIGLLIILAIQINFFYHLGMMPTQNYEIVPYPITGPGSSLPIFLQMLLGLF